MKHGIKAYILFLIERHPMTDDPKRYKNGFLGTYAQLLNALNHPIGGVTDRLVKSAAAEAIERLITIESAARNVAGTLNGGFVRCERCGEQETTTDLDFSKELYAALAMLAAKPSKGTQ